MGHFAIAHVIGAPPRPACTQAQISFFEIQEIRLVKQTDLFQCLAPDHHAGTGQPIDGAGSVGDRHGHDMPGQQPADHADPRRARQLSPDRGEAERGAVRIAIRSVDRTAGDARLWLRFQMRDQLANSALIGEGVGIQEIDVIRRDRLEPVTHAEIVPGAKAAIVPRLDDLYPVRIPAARFGASQ